jgi:outer membrane receptor protein involved in Fe transport
VVVTGSRVVRNGDSSPSPVTVVSTDDLMTAKPGATLAEALTTMPVFAGSRGASSNPTTAGSAAGGSGSANQLNLRNIGATRTLILMDGKRVPPTLYNSAVDVDLIPQMFVQRVDIVTGGVSAVYGSDAMSGVVNYIIDHKFNGFKSDASYGKSTYGDGGKYDANIGFGATLARGLHVEGGLEVRKDNGIDHRSDRDWLNQVGVTGAGTAANPYVLQSNLRQKQFPFGGQITSGALNGQVFKQNGVLSPFVAGTPTGTTAIQLGGDGGYWDSGLLARLKGTQLFGRLDYDMAQDVHAYAQVSGNLKTNTNFAETNQLNNVTLRRTNAFLPAQYQALIPAAQPTFTYSQFLSEIPRLQADSDTRAMGVRDRPRRQGRRLEVERRLYLWPGAPRYGDGQRHQPPEPGGVAGCREQRRQDGVQHHRHQSRPGGQLRPAECLRPERRLGRRPRLCHRHGPLQFHYRDERRHGSGHRQPLRQLGRPGERGAVRRMARPVVLVAQQLAAHGPGQLHGTGPELRLHQHLDRIRVRRKPAAVSQHVWEMAGEVDVPLLRDAPFAKKLDLNTAARYTKYDRSGNYGTWKVGLEWSVTDQLRVRGTRSRDIRAPTLYDLYAPQSQVVVRPTDLLTGASPAVPQIDQSNPDLKAEIGNTTTLGVVWKPMPKLSFAVDAYRMKISDAITTVSGSTAAFQTACYQSGGSSPYCALQVRPNGYTDTSAANAVTGWVNKSVNISNVETYGLDFETNYSTRLFGRPASLRFLTAWQPHVIYRQPGLTTIDQGGAAFGPGGMAATPSVRLSAYLRFRPIEDVTVDITRALAQCDEDQRRPDRGLGRTTTSASFGTTGINLAYKLGWGNGDVQVYFNVENLFDATPPIGAFEGNGTRAGLRDGFALGDDPRGRYYTVGIRSLF